MKRDSIDVLLQLAFLEGTVTTHGLYEKTVAGRTPGMHARPQARRALLKKLERALESRRQSGLVSTVGMFLRETRPRLGFKTSDILPQVGISANVYRMLEHDRISPLKVSVESWKKLFRLFRAPADEIALMMRRTFQVVLFEPSFRTTLARYSPRKTRTRKSDVLHSAAKELYTRASLQLPAKEEENLLKLLKAISS